MKGADGMYKFINKKIFFFAFIIIISILALQTAFNLPLNIVIAYPFFVLFSFVYPMLHKIRKKSIFIIFYIGLIILGIIGMTYFLEGGRIVYNLIVTGYEQTSKYTFDLYDTVEIEQFPLYVTILCMYVFIWLYAISYECLKRNSSFVPFLTSFVVFFPILLYSTPQPWLFTLPLLACWLTLLLSAFSVKMKIKNQDIYLKPFLISLTLILAFFFMMPESNFSTRAGTQRIRDMLLNKIDMFVYNITHSGEAFGEVDLGRAGNRYYSGATQLTVTSENKNDRIYLKSYSGAIYENNHWVSLADSDYASLNDSMQTDSFTWFNEYVYEGGKLSEDRKNDLTRKLFKMSIEDQRASKTYAIYPYMMQSSKTKLKNHFDAYMESDTNDYEYMLWNKEQLGTYYTEAIHSDYQSFVKTHYLQIPYEIENTLASTNLVFDRNAENVTSSYVIEKVQEYLADHTSYTLSPGRTPDGEDFVEYFLNENRQGYCVHYATTATLLLRYYGIPARYAEGFVVEPSDYNGFVAKVPDRNAHAWVEIFDDEKGWIPIEVTPTFTDSQKENTTANKIEENADEKNKNQQTTENNQSDEIDTSDSANTADVVETKSFNLEMIRYLILAAGIILSLLVIIIQRNIRLGKRKKACLQKDYRKAVIQSYAYMCKCEAGTGIDESIQALIDKAQFSKHDITAAQSIQVYKYAIHRVKQHYQSLSLYKKIVFRFWKALW